MANPLESAMTSPPAPNPQGGNALQQGVPQQPQSAPQPPSHDEVVATLRHVDAIKAELTPLLKDPALGKSDIHSKIIDGVTSLVSQRIIKPAEAVMQLSKVPENPLEQRKWLQQQMMNAIQSANAVLAHHGAAFAGGGPQPTPSADGHMDAMAALHSRYGGNK